MCTGRNMYQWKLVVFRLCLMCWVLACRAVSNVLYWEMNGISDDGASQSAL